MIAEVTSTPWGERRSYVLSAGDGGLSGEFEKLMHVSPFMPMEQLYEWSATEPGERLSVAIRNREDDRVVFEAGPLDATAGDDPSRDARDTVPVSAHDDVDHRTDLLERRPPEAQGRALLPPARGRRGRGQLMPSPASDPWRRVVHAVLRRIEAGAIEIEERFPGGELRSFGPTSSPLRARVVVHDPAVYRRLARSKSIAFGQTYAERGWETDDLIPLLRIAARDIGRADRLRRRLAPLLVPFQRFGTLRMLNTRNGARDNIARHYDLGNEMFELFLDHEAMMYSSAYYETGDETLERAQHVRLERICDSLELDASDHLLEIGTGGAGWRSTRPRPAAAG